MDRRMFLQILAASGLAPHLASAQGKSQDDLPLLPRPPYHPGRIDNEYSMFLPGEKEALAAPPSVSILPQASRNEAQVDATSKSGTSRLPVGKSHDGWQLLTVSEINGVSTAVFEKHVTHRGAIAYVTEAGGAIAIIPKYIGKLSSIRPRQINTPHHIAFEPVAQFNPQPDIVGRYILDSSEDPCYENVAALGPEYIGWSLVANEEAGPLASVYLEPDGTSREFPSLPEISWAPDKSGPLFDPQRFLPQGSPQCYEYQHGYSKRTLLGGFLPVANTGVWNARFGAGYEVIMLLPPGKDAKPLARFRLQPVPGGEPAHGRDSAVTRNADGHVFVDTYWNCEKGQFYAELLGIWNHWDFFFQKSMQVDIPDEWLVDAARAGITLSRCSYQGLKPSNQIGEGGYTKVPELDRPAFPVSSYEFIWAHQLWNLTTESDPYFQFYLDNYILPDGDFLFNTLAQVEAPLNTGVFLANSARAFNYTRDLNAFEKRLPVLTRMLEYVLDRYEYSKARFPKPDRRHGLIWGSAEADLGEPYNNTPDSYPYYYQNATWTWRGLIEHSRALKSAASSSNNSSYRDMATRYERLAREMRQNITESLDATIACCNPAMRKMGITPFEPNDIDRPPTKLTSYENHRFMMDFFTSDWGVRSYDEGHLKHRSIAGEEICGLSTDGHIERTSNFMAHGTLSVRIRQEDYRPFLLTLYALACYAADSGNRYSPEDAYIPGGHPEEGSKYFWSAVINSALQPALGLRWLLCYEESDEDVCHLQKAAPKHWFAKGKTIAVKQCPTRFGMLEWATEAMSDRQWKIELKSAAGFSGDIMFHIHPPGDLNIAHTSAGQISKNTVSLPKSLLAKRTSLEFEVSC